MRLLFLLQVLTISLVSIHASVKDATFDSATNVVADVSFNPRICKRCDLECEEFARRVRVSIHASVKDATIALSVERNRWRVSIHASVKDATS